MSQEPLFFDGEFEQHQCSSQREGDWIIFRCRQCDYIRKLNYKTREMEVEGGDMNAMHAGFSIPPAIQPENTNLN